MQIVIEITDRMYENIKQDRVPIDIGRFIRNGTPLPKEHGRLGDIDALETEIVNGIKAGNYEEGYEKYGHINNIDDCVECVKYANTIVEAYNESEVKE